MGHSRAGTSRQWGRTQKQGGMGGWEAKSPNSHMQTLFSVRGPQFDQGMPSLPQLPEPLAAEAFNFPEKRLSAVAEVIQDPQSRSSISAELHFQFLNERVFLFVFVVFLVFNVIPLQVFQFESIEIEKKKVTHILTTQR